VGLLRLVKGGGISEAVVIVQFEHDELELHLVELCTISRSARALIGTGVTRTKECEQDAAIHVVGNGERELVGDDPRDWNAMERGLEVVSLDGDEALLERSGANHDVLPLPCQARGHGDAVSLNGLVCGEVREQVHHAQSVINVRESVEEARVALLDLQYSVVGSFWCRDSGAGLTKWSMRYTGRRAARRRASWSWPLPTALRTFFMNAFMSRNLARTGSCARKEMSLTW
jgi:hypothetical protein